MNSDSIDLILTQKILLKRIFVKFMLKFDGRLFAKLFNVKSFMLRSPARIQWQNDYFLVYDRTLPALKQKIRHQKQCNRAYEFGFGQRIRELKTDYFLDKIPFEDNDVFLDCGANVGDLKLFFESENILIDYVAFEPSPIEYRLLDYNVSPSVVHNCALWNEDKEISFYLSSQSADSSAIEPNRFDTIIRIQGKRLASFIDKRIKCLKIEAEGSELEVLEGLGDSIELIEYLTGDFGFERGIRQECTLPSVTNFLTARGFEMIDISQRRMTVLWHNKIYRSGTI